MLSETGLSYVVVAGAPASQLGTDPVSEPSWPRSGLLP
jgi:hypothetical protein